MVCPSLGDIQGQAFDRPVIVLAERLGGMEDIPEGVVAVLTESSTDVLSHVAIRARTQGVLLATCFGDSEWQALNELQVWHAVMLYIWVCCSACVLSCPASGCKAPTTEVATHCIGI